MNPKERSTFRDKVQGWTCNHFSVHTKEGDIVWLLQELAKQIASLGKIEVLDVVVIHERDGETDGVTGTVYFYFPKPDEEQPGSMPRTS